MSSIPPPLAFSPAARPARRERIETAHPQAATGLVMALFSLALPAGLTRLPAILPHNRYGRPQGETRALAQPGVVPGRADISAGKLAGTKGRLIPPLRSQGQAE